MKLLTALQYQAHAMRAVGATRLALGRGSLNRWDERDSSNYGALVTGVTTPFTWAAKLGLHVVSRVASWSADSSNLAGIQRIAVNARTAQVGNCEEHAAVCFVELLAEGVRPVHFTSFDDCSHAFVVVGLDISKIPKNLNITEPRNWNPEAIIADAWADKVGRADALFPGKKVLIWCTVK